MENRLLSQFQVEKASQAETDWCSTILSGYDKSNGVAGEEHQGLQAAAGSQEEQGRPLFGCRENMALPTPRFWISNLQNSEELVSSHSVCGPRWLNDKESAAMQKLQEMQVLSLGGEEPLEEGKATHSSVLAWRIPWTEEPGGLQSIGSQRVGYD